MVLFYFLWETPWQGFSVLFDRITPEKAYFLETTIPSYSNSRGKAHLDDYWAKYGCISAFSPPKALFELLIHIAGWNTPKNTIILGEWRGILFYIFS